MKQSHEPQNEIRKSINSQQNLWTTFIENGNIDAVDEKILLEYIEMTKQQKKEQEILKNHLENFYHIWQNDKGIYLSYLPAPDKPKGRKPVTAGTREKLEQKIIAFYLAQETAEEENKTDKDAPTLKTLYPRWLKFKSLETTATTYIRRIDTDWKKYYLDDSIIDMDVRKFTKAMLKEWALLKIRSMDLTKHQYYNMAVIIRQCLDYAVDYEILKENPYSQFTVDGKLFRKVKKPEDSTQVFLKSERPLIEAEAWKEFEEKGCTTALAIPLAFQIGVRLGELVTLKSSDISKNGKYIHIQRMAQRLERQRPDGTWYPTKWIVVEHTKSSAGDRYIYLSKEARRIIKVILESNREHGFFYQDFLFVHGGRRITHAMVNSRIGVYCDHINIQRKSSHKIRKSYISALLDGGLNINEVRKQAGHEDERTTLKNYCFNRNDIVTNEADIEKALAG